MIIKSQETLISLLLLPLSLKYFSLSRQQVWNLEETDKFWLKKK